MHVVGDKDRKIMHIYAYTRQVHKQVDFGLYNKCRDYLEAKGGKTAHAEIRLSFIDRLFWPVYRKDQPPYKYKGDSRLRDHIYPIVIQTNLSTPYVLIPLSQPLLLFVKFLGEIQRHPRRPRWS